MLGRWDGGRGAAHGVLCRWNAAARHMDCGWGLTLALVGSKAEPGPEEGQGVGRARGGGGVGAWGLFFVGFFFGMILLSARV